MAPTRLTNDFIGEWNEARQVLDRAAESSSALSAPLSVHVTRHFDRSTCLTHQSPRDSQKAAIRFLQRGASSVASSSQCLSYLSHPPPHCSVRAAEAKRHFDAEVTKAEELLTHAVGDACIEQAETKVGELHVCQHLFLVNRSVVLNRVQRDDDEQVGSKSDVET
jgi:hypothetical protein